MSAPRAFLHSSSPRLRLGEHGVEIPGKFGFRNADRCHFAYHSGSSSSLASPPHSQQLRGADTRTQLSKQGVSTTGAFAFPAGSHGRGLDIHVCLGGGQRGRKDAMIASMEPLHISEGDLARDVRSILKQVETGAEVIIERDAQPVAVIRPAEPARRKISECIALMPAGSTATIDPGFAKDVEAAIAAHREPLEPPAWD
jgi:antitoxin (DNA-binding transcriptional repressor) of toxin-antitoxin stability system